MIIMSNKKNKPGDRPIGQFMLAETFKLLNKHPNRTFNYKQVSKQVRAAFIEFLEEFPGADPKDPDLHEEMRQEARRALLTLAGRGDLEEVERGSFRLKPRHAYLEGVIDITSGGAAYLLSETDEDDVFIGMNCTILKGVKLSSGSVIGAGSVVTHDIPARVVAAGIPAKVISTLD